MKHLKKFNESITETDVEHLFVDFIDNGGIIEVKNPVYPDIFNIEDDIDTIHINSLNLNNLEIYGTFKSLHIMFKNINDSITKDMILFANDILAGYGYNFKFMELFRNEDDLFFSTDINQEFNKFKFISCIYVDMS